MKTYSPKPEHIERRWFVIDASGAVLGRLASEAAAILRGKHKPIFAPHMDTGDHVVIVNAEKVVLTGGKEHKKVSYRHSGFPGGIRAAGYERLLSERPAFVLEKAIRGMLPKNRLGRAMIRKLHVVTGPEHRHAAQAPVALRLGDRPAWDGLPLRKAAPEEEPGSSVEESPPASATSGARRGTRTSTARRSPKSTSKTASSERAGSKRSAAKPAARKRTAAKETQAKRTATKRGAGKETATSPAAARSTGTRRTAKSTASKTSAPKAAKSTATAKRKAAKRDEGE
jgi:large subunit ribosomal protein L13